MSAHTAILWLSRRDRIVVVVGLVSIVVLAWAYLLFAAGHNMRMAMGGAMAPMPWTLATFGIVLVMWIVMMIAMMLPSAAPMILLFVTLDRKKASSTSWFRASSWFALGYLVVWTAFSSAATSAQWGLDQARLLSPAMATSSAVLAGTVFLLAGVYQLTPLKQACLRQCRSPLDFLTRYWRSGGFGAFRMGLRHGIFCVGCCWAVMALLFAGGAMNVLWIATLASFVLVEKLFPYGFQLGRVAGVVSILWGGVTLLAAVT